MDVLIILTQDGAIHFMGIGKICDQILESKFMLSKNLGNIGQ